MTRWPAAVFLFVVLFLGLGLAPILPAQAVSDPLAGSGVFLGVESGSSANFDRVAGSLLRKTIRRGVSTTHTSVKAWFRYGKRAVRWLALALLVAIFDRNLMAAWRRSGRKSANSERLAEKL